MLRGPRARSPRLWFKRFSIAALCSAVLAALSVWSLERRVSNFGPDVVFVTGTGPDAPIRLRGTWDERPRSGEHVLLIDMDRYGRGFPYFGVTSVSYLMVWEDPPPPGDATFPDPARVDDLMFECVLPFAVRLDPALSRISPGSRRGIPMQGQRVLQGFDTVGAIADLSLVGLGVSALGWVVCVYALVREHVRRAVKTCIRSLAGGGLSREQRRRRLVLDGMCPDCDYEVDHTKQPRCPECGCDLLRVLRDGIV